MRADQILSSLFNDATAAPASTPAGQSASISMPERMRQGGDSVREATRMVLSPSVAAIISELADIDTVDRTREQLFLPFDNLWIEWDGKTPGLAETAHALHFCSVGEDLRRAQGMLYFRWRATPGIEWLPIPLSLDLTGDGPMLKLIGQEVRNRVFDLIGADPGKLLDQRAFGAWIGAALALFNTPRAYQTVAHNQAKLNRARAKAGKPALLEYRDVVLTLGQQPSGSGASQHGREQVALHHVRGHLRIRLGKVEFVRPHQRGTSEAGIRVKRYVVRSPGEHSGSWREPLPPSRILAHNDLS